MAKMLRFNRLKRRKKRACAFCEQKANPDYKDITFLRQFVSERGKIVGKDKTGVCPKHQRLLAQAVKRARHLALLLFVNKI